MTFGKFFRKAAAAFLGICVLTVCGCSVKFNTVPQESDVVAKPGANGSADLEVTYGEFQREYRYFLMQYGIEDDTAADYSEACRKQRETIINGLIIDKIYLKKAKEMNIPELTEEERADVRETLEEQFRQQAMYYGKKALGISTDTSESDTSDSSDTSNGGSGYSDEEILARGNEEFNKSLEKCGVSRDTFIQWGEEYLIFTKVMDEIVKDITRQDAEKRFEENVKSIEELYNSENKEYYFESGYEKYWVPEGSRRIKHVLLGFDGETQTRIQAFRKDGKDDEADALREEKAADFGEKIKQVEALLDDNIDFNTILLNYSADAAASSMYPDGYFVVPDDTHYVKEFTEAAFRMEKPGDRTVCTTDFGVHIMIYASDAKPDEEAVKKQVDSLLVELYQETVAKKTEEWQKEYDYEIDREKLRIETQTSSSS